jgi:hypothetical protein
MPTSSPTRKPENATAKHVIASIARQDANHANKNRVAEKNQRGENGGPPLNNWLLTTGYAPAFQ